MIMLAACSAGEVARLTDNDVSEVDGAASTSSTERGLEAVDDTSTDAVDFQGDYAIDDEQFGTSVRVTITDGVRTIQTNALPNHETGEFPNDGNPNSMSAQDLTWAFPLVPSYVDTAVTVQVPGVAINGVKFEPGTAETVTCSTGEVYRVDGLQDIVNLGMDMNNAHVQPTGEYHYHGVADALVDRYAEGDDMVLVGFAADGHLIYHSVSDVWSSGYVLKTEPRSGSSCALSLPGGVTMELDGSTPDGTFVDDWVWVGGTDALDDCNGTMVNGEYAYVLTDEFPFIPRCLHGEVNDTASGVGMGTGGQGGPMMPPPAGAGPQTPPCGEFEIDSREVFGGVTFEPGSYVVHAFGIACDDVLGDTGVIAQFLALDDDDPLPGPWRHLDDAVGAPKFVSGPRQGFRVQRAS